MKEKKTKKRAGAWIALALIAVLAAGGWLFFTRYAFFRGRILPRDTAELDLRGEAVTGEDLERAGRLFAGAHILRDVTIGGIPYSSDAAEIVTGDFGAGDIPRFSEFDDLRRADVTACSDVDVILALRAAAPELEVTWTVDLAGERLSGDTTEIRAEDADARELTEALERLPYIESVILSDSSLTAEEQLSLKERFPAVSFGWTVEVEGRRFPAGTEVLDLEDAHVTDEALAEIEARLPLLEQAAELRLGYAAADETAIRAFADRHPELTVVWRTELFGVEISTDQDEIVFDDIPLTAEDAAQIEALTAYMPSLERVSMQRCGVDNETMEALYQRNIDRGVKFVWMVRVNNRGVPTDQTFYHNYRWSNPDTDYYFSTSAGYDQLRYCHDMIAMDLGHVKIYGNLNEEPTIFENMPHLRYLVVSDCQHTSLSVLTHCPELEWLELFWTNCSDITWMAECKNLQHVNIAYKRVRDQAADLATLKQMTWLKRLYFSANMYSPAQVQELMDALPDTVIRVIETDDCASLGWRDEDKVYFDARDALHMYYINDDNNMVRINPFTGERSQYEWTNPFR